MLAEVLVGFPAAVGDAEHVVDGVGVPAQDICDGQWRHYGTFMRIELPDAVHVIGNPAMSCRTVEESVSLKSFSVASGVMVRRSPSLGVSVWLIKPGWISSNDLLCTAK